MALAYVVFDVVIPEDSLHAHDPTLLYDMIKITLHNWMPDASLEESPNGERVIVAPFLWGQIVKMYFEDTYGIQLIRQSELISK